MLALCVIELDVKYSRNVYLLYKSLFLCSRNVDTTSSQGLYLTLMLMKTAL